MSIFQFTRRALLILACAGALATVGCDGDVGDLGDFELCDRCSDDEDCEDDEFCDEGPDVLCGADVCRRFGS